MIKKEREHVPTVIIALIIALIVSTGSFVSLWYLQGRQLNCVVTWARDVSARSNAAFDTQEKLHTTLHDAIIKANPKKVAREANEYDKAWQNYFDVATSKSTIPRPPEDICGKSLL